MALEVHVVPLLDVVRVEVVAHLKRHHRLVWREGGGEGVRGRGKCNTDGTEDKGEVRRGKG